MEVHEMTCADIHAEALARAGWSFSFTSYVNGDGRKMIVADAHKDGVRLSCQFVEAAALLSRKRLRRVV
jgi:hypothetical protein